MNVCSNLVVGYGFLVSTYLVKDAQKVLSEILRPFLMDGELESLGLPEEQQTHQEDATVNEGGKDVASDQLPPSKTSDDSETQARLMLKEEKEIKETSPSPVASCSKVTTTTRQSKKKLQTKSKPRTKIKPKKNWYMFHDEYKEMYETNHVFIVHRDTMICEYENTRGSGGYGFVFYELPKISEEIKAQSQLLKKILKRRFKEIQGASWCVYHCFT